MIRPLHFNHNVGSIDAFTTERGAADIASPYSEFNCCDYTGDSAEHIIQCRKALCSDLGIAADHIVTARQTHSAEVAIIDRLPVEPLVCVDALVTKLRGVVVGVFTADCVPILLCDPAEGVIAAVHAGWRGTVAGIAANAVRAMESIGAKAERIEAVVGPSICQKCFEVGNEVVAEFARHALSLNSIIVRNSTTFKAHIDLAAANCHLLEQSGVPRGNILMSGLCTKCHPDRFFSARNLGVNSGRVLTGIIRH